MLHSPDRLTHVGWVRWDGDEFHGFVYANPSDDESALLKQGFMPVYAEMPVGS